MRERAWVVPISDTGVRGDRIPLAEACAADCELCVQDRPHATLPIPTVLKAVLRANCQRFVLMHEHPKGLYPSAEDMSLTTRFDAAAAFLGMRLEAHEIVNEAGDRLIIERRNQRWEPGLPIAASKG